MGREAGVIDTRAEEAVAELEELGRTTLIVWQGGPGDGHERAVGVIGISDEMRDGAAEAVSELLLGDVETAVMLTGDNERTAAAVAQAAGVPQYRARLLPEDKVGAVKDLQGDHGVVAMVGDGVNDAPALATSDLGIAMGAAGSDTAIETADVALMSDDLSALPRFFDLGKRTVANIRQNVVFSVGVKIAVLIAAIAGYAPLWLAVFADTGVALLVILNGLRLLRPAPRSL
jgi:Cd2+/Zn2+-exporting ATPase